MKKILLLILLQCVCSIIFGQKIKIAEVLIEANYGLNCLQETESHFLDHRKMKFLYKGNSQQYCNIFTSSKTNGLKVIKTQIGNWIDSLNGDFIAVNISNNIIENAKKNKLDISFITWLNNNSTLFINKTIASKKANKTIFEPQMMDGGQFIISLKYKKRNKPISQFKYSQNHLDIPENEAIFYWLGLYQLSKNISIFDNKIDLKTQFNDINFMQNLYNYYLKTLEK